MTDSENQKLALNKLVELIDNELDLYPPEVRLQIANSLGRVGKGIIDFTFDSLQQKIDEIADEGKQNAQSN